MNLMRRFVVAVVPLFLCLAVKAAPITLNFQASGFTPEFGSFVPPTDPVIGSFVFDADSPISPIDSVISADLTIDGHTYDLSEVGFFTTAIDTQIIGGILNDVGGVVPGDDDFFIVWNQTTLSPISFVYSVPSVTLSNFESTTFNQFSVLGAPEPTGLVLFTASIVPALWLWWLRNGKRRGADNG